MSSIAPPPTGGGNAKYVVVVVLLLVGIGGLLYWRTHAATDTNVVTIHPPDANAPVPVNPHLDDDVPPPPPPLPDAGPEVKPTGTGGRPQANCSMPKCPGTVSPDLETALAFRAKQAHACYDQALANDSSLKGHVSIGVRVASNGQVCSANVSGNDMGSSTVAQCVANKFRQTGFFPSPRGGCVDVNVPLNFVPGGK
jgi:hypothetical protein